MTRRSGFVIVTVEYEVEVEYEEWTGMYGEDADGRRGIMETNYTATGAVAQTVDTPLATLCHAQDAFEADPQRWLT